MTSDRPRLRVVNNTGIGPDTKIFIDDQDVSSCFNSVAVKTDVGTGVTVELNAICCEVEIGEAMHLRMPVDGTRDLLIKHGWVPPVEPVEVPAEKIVTPYESIIHDLVEPGETISGEDLIERFFERVKEKWTPNLDDTLTVTRTRRGNGTLIPGRRTYTLRVTMDGVHPDPDPGESPRSLVAAANDWNRARYRNEARDRNGDQWWRVSSGTTDGVSWFGDRWCRMGVGGELLRWAELDEQFGPMVGPFDRGEERDDC